MGPLDFLAAVLPTAGVYCACELSTRKKEHVFVGNLQELEASCHRLDARGLNSYFALASFVTAENRTTENALYLRALAIDIDCGATKPYPNRKAGLQALQQFLQSSGFPDPLLVTSGNGWHVYWPLTENIPADTWRVAGERLKRLCGKYGLQIDSFIGANAAQVLRLPGTRNWKNPAAPRFVEIVSPLDTAYDFDALAERLKTEINGHDFLTPSHSTRLSAASLPGTPIVGAGLKLMENTQSHFRVLWNRTLEGTGCKQLEWYWQHAGKTATEGVWRPLISIAKHCVDGEKAAIKLTALHPRPDSEFNSKWRVEEGPWGCDKFHSNNPGVCTTCTHWQKITNPLALARVLQADNAPKPLPPTQAQAALSAATATTEQITYTRPAPPRGFSYGRHGGVFADLQETDTQGNSFTRQVCLLPYDLYVVDAFAASGGGNVHMVRVKNNDTIDIFMPSMMLAKKEQLMGFLHANNVVVENPAHDKLLHTYLRSSTGALLANKTERRAPDTYGWQPDGSFVINHKAYTEEGNIVSAPSENLRNLYEITQPNGTLAKWQQSAQMFVKLNDPKLLLGFSTALGAPLMNFVGYNFLLVNMQSNQTGSNKSNTLRLAASVYGHPEHYWINPETSPGTVQTRMGNLGSLPVIVDELTNKLRGVQPGKWIEEFLMSGTLGKGKERQKQSGGIEQQNTARWETLALFSSNQSFTDALMARNLATNAEMMRMLEIEMHEPAYYSAEQERLIHQLRANHGVAGALYIRWLVQNKDKAARVVDRMREFIRRDMGLEGPERFWREGLACMLAGAVLFGRGYANILTLPVDAMLDAARETVARMRRLVTGNVKTANDIFSDFIMANYGKMLIVRKETTGISVALGLNGVKEESLRTSDVRGRIEHGFVPGIVSIYLPRRELFRHCAEIGYGSERFVATLFADPRYRVDPDCRKFLFQGTKGASDRIRCVRVDMQESEWNMTAST